MKAMLFCLIVAVILTFVSYRAMTTPPDAPLLAHLSGSGPDLRPLLDGDNGPWL
jgi:hypothetical protein